MFRSKNIDKTQTKAPRARFLVRQTLGLYWSSMRKHWGWIALHLPTIMVAVVLQNILGPYMIARGIKALPGFLADPSASFGATFGGIIAIYVAAQIGCWIFWRLSGWAVIHFEPLVMRDLEQRSFAHLTTLSNKFFSGSFSGALVAKANRFVGSFEKLYDTLSFDITPLLLRLTLSLVIIVTFAPLVALVLAGFSVVFVLLAVLLFRWKAPASKESAAVQSQMTARLADNLANISAIKYFAREDDEIDGYNNISQKQFRARFRDWGLGEVVYAAQASLLISCETIIFILALNLVAGHRIDLGQFVLIQAYTWSVFGSLWSVGRIVRNIERSFSDAIEMTEIMLSESEVRDVGGAPAVAVERGEVVFDKARFAYRDDGKSQKVLEGLNLQIQPGEKVGLVGPSGGGKTTVTKLLLRLMDLDRGRILLDGYNIARMRQVDVRRAISYVPQEPLLFHRSLRENIAYGRPDATDEQVREAAVRAHAAEFIDKLPLGYDTLVGERGVKLSGGQRQRVAIARAMLKPAPILVLDEATSALDSESEQLIQDALWKLMEGRTAVVIAHRLSTIQRMDRIVVLADGGVVEQGSHAELLAAGGLYARLWTRQSGGFIEEDGEE